MTVSSLITAVAIGIVLGLCVRWIMPAGREVPFWVPVAVAVGAAVLGTVVARFAGIHTAGVSPVEVFLQVVFASTAVLLVAGTADRSPEDRRHNGIGRSR